MKGKTKKRTPYEVLGTDSSASRKEIRKAHRKLVLRYHPDRNVGDPEAASKLQEVNDAYAELMGRTKEPDNEHAKVFWIIAEVMFGVLGKMAEDGVSPIHHDLCAIIRTNIKNQIGEIFRSKVKWEDTKKRFEETRGRFKGKEAESMEALVASQIQDIETKLAEIADLLPLMERACEIISNSSFSFDKPSMKATMRGYMSTTGFQGTWTVY